MEIIKESVREFAHGHTSVGKSRKKLSELTFHFNSKSSGLNLAPVEDPRPAVAADAASEFGAVE